MIDIDKLRQLEDILLNDLYSVTRDIENISDDTLLDILDNINVSYGIKVEVIHTPEDLAKALTSSVYEKPLTQAQILKEQYNFITSDGKNPKYSSPNSFIPFITFYSEPITLLYNQNVSTGYLQKKDENDKGNLVITPTFDKTKVTIFSKHLFEFTTYYDFKNSNQVIYVYIPR
ncbi:MAG: hypothetical protein RR922_04910 [Clostridia bacterium]